MKRAWKRKAGTLAIAASLLLSVIPVSLNPTTATAAAPAYNYGEVLQKSMYFYEAQRSGKLPATNRVPWRGDTALNDGADAGLDLTGGWFDAGDHVKFNFPMAASVTLLAWGAIEYGQAYEETGQMDELLGNLKWVTDYFIKSHPEPNVLYGQVGDGGLDHAYWGPAETMTMARPAFRIDATHPGSDLAGETAAALAASSILFKTDNPAYAATLLTHARQLFTFADTYRGKYSDSIKGAQGYYTSFSGYHDELAWAAIWLYQATGEAAYLAYAENATANWAKENYGNSPYWEYKWGLAWDDKHYAAQVLLAKLTGKAVYKQNAERSLDYWTTGIAETGERIHYTPGGLAWLDQWGALRYAANASFLAFVYSDWLMPSNAAKATTYRNFAERQINYALGDNPANRSYVIGFGNNPPINPHHRNAHGSVIGSIGSPVNNQHILYGALVGGPGSDDSYTDDRNNYTNNEVATDYNSGFSGALAKMILLHGGTPLAAIPGETAAASSQFYAEASAVSYTPNMTAVNTYLNNASTLPPRASSKLSLRYYVDLTELLQAGYTAADINVKLDNAAGATISGLTQWTGSVYYVTVDLTGTSLYPGDINRYRKQANFSLNAPSGAPWNPANDWSYQGLTGTLAKTARIPVYENGVLLAGQEPPGGGVIEVPTAPTGLAATAGNGTVSLTWDAVSGATGYTVKRATTSGGPYTTLAANWSGPAYTDSTVSNGTAYYYVVAAVNSAGSSPVSSEASATPQAPSTAPGPFTLSGTGGNASAALIWTAASGAASYTVARSTAGGASAILAADVTALTYTDATAVNGITYTYQVTAVNSAGSTLSNPVTLTPQAPVNNGSLTLEYRTGDTNATDNQIKPYFNIKNTGSAAVDLSGLTIRYYFTKDGSASMNAWVDWAAVGSSIVTASFGSLTATGADTYLEIGFASGTIPPGGQTGDIQLRLAKADWSNFNEANDYSYDATHTAYSEWSHVTLYQAGSLISGIPPQ